MAEQQTVVAVDWGGTWFRAALIDRRGEVSWQRREANPQGGTRDDYLGLARIVLNDAIRAADSVAGISVAVAGPVDPESGVLYQPPNLQSMDGVSLKEEWAREFGLPVTIGNDANFAALGEFYYGAGKEAAEQGRPVKTLFYVTISTGIGGGVVDRGGLFLGANGLTAEVGHTTVDSADGAPLCNCGNRGCLEAAASGTGIARVARRLLAGGGYESSPLAADPEALTSITVFEAAGRGDALGQEALAPGPARPVHRPHQRPAPVQPGHDSLGRRRNRGAGRAGSAPPNPSRHPRPLDERAAQGLPPSRLQLGRQRRYDGSRGGGVVSIGRLAARPYAVRLGLSHLK